MIICIYLLGACIKIILHYVMEGGVKSDVEYIWPVTHNQNNFFCNCVFTLEYRSINVLAHLFLTDTRTVMHNLTGDTCMKLNAESKSLDRQNMSIYIYSSCWPDKMQFIWAVHSANWRQWVVLDHWMAPLPDKMLRLLECTLRLHYYTPRHPAAGWSGKINCSTEIFTAFEKWDQLEKFGVNISLNKA